MRKNWDSLKNTISNTDINWEIIILTEINIKEEDIEIYNLDGYKKNTLIMKSTKRGGGIMVFSRENLQVKCKEIIVDENNVLEIEIQHSENKTSTRIIAVYRKPDASRKEFIKNLKIY